MGTWLLVVIFGWLALVGLLAIILFLIFYFQGEDHMEVLRRSLRKADAWQDAAAEQPQPARTAAE